MIPRGLRLATIREMRNHELAKRVATVARLEGEFRLRSGLVSKEYFDKYQFEARPDLLRSIAADLIPLIPPGTQVLAGLELGGVPLATAMALSCDLPLAFVRKEAKEYGTGRQAEGVDVSGKQILVVEDVITTGGQVVKSVEQLRANGATVNAAVCVIDREQGGQPNLAEVQVELRSLFKSSDL